MHRYYNIYYENLNFNEIEKDDITSKNKQIENNFNTDVGDDIKKLNIIINGLSYAVFLIRKLILIF